MTSGRHHHRRVQYATAPAILVRNVARIVNGAAVPFDATGWTVFFRMWGHVAPGHCGSTEPIVADEAATQPAVGQLAYQPRAQDVVNAGHFRGVFWAQRVSDGTRDFWPVQTIEILPVAGGEPA